MKRGRDRGRGVGGRREEGGGGKRKKKLGSNPMKNSCKISFINCIRTK